MKQNADNITLLEMPELAAVIASTPPVKIAAGETLFQRGDLCTTLPLVVSGSASVCTQDQHGHLVTLYRLEPDNICPISLSMLLQHSTYPASAIAETPTLIRYLSGEDVKTAITGTPDIFRAFLNTLAGGLYDSACIARRLITGTNDNNDNKAGVITERAVQ